MIVDTILLRIQSRKLVRTLFFFILVFDGSCHDNHLKNSFTRHSLITLENSHLSFKHTLVI